MYSVLYLAGIWKDAVDNYLPQCRLAGLVWSKYWFNAGGLIQGAKQNCPIRDGRRWVWKGRWEHQQPQRRTGTGPRVEMPSDPSVHPSTYSLFQPVGNACLAQGRRCIKNCFMWCAWLIQKKQNIFPVLKGLKRKTCIQLQNETYVVHAQWDSWLRG